MLNNPNLMENERILVTKAVTLVGFILKLNAKSNVVFLQKALKRVDVIKWNNFRIDILIES